MSYSYSQTSSKYEKMAFLALAFYTLDTQAVDLFHSGYQKTGTVKPDHSKIDKTKILMKYGSLMKVESIAECSTWSILQYY